MMREPSPADQESHGERAKSRSLKPLAAVVRYLRPYGAVVAGASVALILGAAIFLGLGAGLRRLVDRGFAAQNPALLDQAVLILIGLVVLLSVTVYARFYLVTWLGERVVADLRRDVFRHVISLSPGYFEVTRTGEVLSRLTTDTTLLQVVVGTSVPIALRNILLLIGGTVALFLTSAKLTLLVFLVVPLVIPPILILGRKVRRLSRESQDRVADVSSSVDETLTGIRVVQAFTHETQEERRFADRVETAFSTAIARTRMRALLTALVMVLVFTAVAAILWTGGHDVIAGRITPGELSAFVFYAVLVAGSVGALSEVVGDLQRAAGATERLQELLATESEITAPEHPKTLPAPPKGAVAFEDVVFHYPSRPDMPALEGFDLSIAPGEKVALVGPSGAGKSTVLQLLLRFYDPEAGRIRLDGVDLREADPKAVRARIGLVPQEPVIFSTTAAENIRYGRPSAGDDEVRAAAAAAHALDFIKSLPHGFDSYLGERGVRLSGGQRQRVAIARAILRDPAVLLLDEATSALDSESERAVQQALDDLMQGRTTIMIAHRLATVLKADRIVVLEGGRIVDSGTHEELVEKGGLYARLAAMQFDDAEGQGPGGARLVGE